MVSTKGRIRQANTLYKDFKPNGSAGIPTFLDPPLPPLPPLSEAAAAELDLDTNDELDDVSESSESSAATRPELITVPDSFGVYRVYQYSPSCEPDQDVKAEELADSPMITGAQPRSRPGWWFGFGSVVQSIVRQHSPMSIDAPFLNQTTLSLMQWFYQARTSTLSLASVQRLVEDVIFSPHWDREELRNFRPQTATRNYDRTRAAVDEKSTSRDQQSSNLPFVSADGWRQSFVQFWVPRDGRKSRSDEDSPPKHMTVGPIWHRNIMQVLQDAIQNPTTGPNMHLTPFRLYWSPDAAANASSSQHPPSSPSSSPDKASMVPENNRSDSPPSPDVPYGGERLWGEVYVGDAMNREHEKIRADISRTHVKPYPETVIAAILLYSDSTRLTQFGNASLWPAYGWFGNWTKYDRGKPSSFATHHLAYIPSVSPSVLFICCIDNLTERLALAPQKFSRYLLSLIRWCRGQQRSHQALQARAHAGCMGASARRRLREGVYKRSTNTLPGWYRAPRLSPYIWILSGLP